MRKKVLLLLVSALVLGAITPVATAAVKPGAKCSKQGHISTTAGKKFTCVKSGTKLIWNKGVSVKAALKPDLNPVLKPVVPLPTSTTTPTPAEPMSFSDIEKKYENVPYWAWKKSKDKIELSKRTFTEFENIIAPNSGILNKNPLTAYDATSRLFSGFAQPSKFYSVSFSFDDLNWAQSKFEELFADPELLQVIQSPNRGGPNQARGICPSSDRCHSSSPSTNSKGTSVILVGYTPTRSTYLGETNGDLQSHEFTHVIQQHQFVGSPRASDGLSSLKQHIPWWLVEGGADFGGIVSTHYGTFSAYSEIRLRDVRAVPKRDAEWFANFINPVSNQEWIPLGSTGEIYNVGFMITEIFTALKGPDAQMEIIRQIAQGKSMDEAFESVFSTPWKEAVPIIARVIAKERAKN
jgi:hypothetical protein